MGEMPPWSVGEHVTVLVDLTPDTATTRAERLTLELPSEVLAVDEGAELVACKVPHLKEARAFWFPMRHFINCDLGRCEVFMSDRDVEFEVPD